jgi:hypothetical protein
VIDKINKVFTTVKSAISTLCPNASQTYSPSVSVFPYMYLTQLGAPETGTDLESNENAVNSTVEITIYTKGATKLQDAKNIMALANDSMKSMGFQRTFGAQQITNATDTEICRYVARFSRVIGSDDTL